VDKNTYTPTTDCTEFPFYAYKLIPADQGVGGSYSYEQTNSFNKVPTGSGSCTGISWPCIWSRMLLNNHYGVKNDDPTYVQLDSHSWDDPAFFTKLGGRKIVGITLEEDREFPRENGTKVTEKMTILYPWVGQTANGDVRQLDLATGKIETITKDDQRLPLQVTVYDMIE
jgi:hypothetical protein